MLVLADRKFLSWSLARDFLATGAHILWRASPLALKPVQVLADGTYLAELQPPRRRRPGDHGPRYRVHRAYRARAGGTQETSEMFALVTDLLDVEEYPALDLAAATRSGGAARPSSAITRPIWARASPSCGRRTPPG